MRLKIVKPTIKTCEKLTTYNEKLLAPNTDSPAVIKNNPKHFKNQDFFRCETKAVLILSEFKNK